jgi:hypothetical protein
VLPHRPGLLRLPHDRSIHARRGGDDGVKWWRRHISPKRGDRLVRWVDLDARGAASDPLTREQVELATMRAAKAA